MSDSKKEKPQVSVCLLLKVAATVALHSASFIRAMIMNDL